VTDISPKSVPDLSILSPAFARRAWLRWLSDHDEPTGQAATDAENVMLAIKEFAMNYGRDSEEQSRKNLAARVATFQTSFTQAAD